MGGPGAEQGGQGEGPNSGTGCCPPGSHRNPGCAQTLPATTHPLQRPRPLSSGAGSCCQGPTMHDSLRGRQGGLQLPCTPPPGCYSLRVPGSPRRGQLLGPGGVTASSATQPTTSPGTCHAGSTAATPSARRACSGWTLRLPSSTGSPAHSAARAHPHPVEGWPCWTSTWPPSWP